jgi:hypothetical protein
MMTSSADVIMRTIVELPDDQVTALDTWCVREGVSRAEGVRRAVGEYLLRDRAATTAAAFGLWRGRKLDGLSYQKTLRAEWDHRA